MRDIERLTLLAGHVASVAAALNTFIQELEALQCKPETPEKKASAKIFKENAESLLFVLQYLTEELEEFLDSLELPPVSQPA